MSSTLTKNTASTNTNAFYSQLIAQVQSTYGNVINGTCYAVDNSPTFAYYIQNNNTVPAQFNNWTYVLANNIGSASTVNSGNIALSGSFWNQYLALVSQITYQLSASDQQTLTKAKNAASTALSTLITDYQNAFGSITSAQLATASTALNITAQPSDYILSYVKGRQWSGYQQSSANPMVTWSQMQYAQNLAALFPNIPPNGSAILPDVTAYLNALGPGAAFTDAVSNGMFQKNCIVNNLQSNMLTYLVNGVSGPGPAASAVFDPTSTLPVQNLPAYSVSPLNAQIVNDLNSTQKVSLTLSVASASENEWSVSVQGSVGFTVDLDFFSFGVESEHTYYLDSVQTFGSSYTITMTFTGFSNVSVSPQLWAGTAWNGVPGTTVGWFNPQMLQQAYQNWQTAQSGGSAPSGFIFVSAPGIGLDQFPEGGFNYISNFLLTNPPTISIQFSEGSYSSFIENYSTQNSGNVSIFGISLANANANYYQSQASQNSDNSGFTLTFSASSTANVPMYQTSAYIVGLVPNSPAA